MTADEKIKFLLEKYKMPLEELERMITKTASNLVIDRESAIAFLMEARIKRMPIKRSWIEFEAEALPSNVSEVQRTETRRAFYAGAQALFTGIITMLDEGQEATEEDLTKMDDIKAELDQFLADVKEGKA